MKKVIIILTILFISVLSFVSCSKNNTSYYEGVFIKANAAECQNIVNITKSIRDGLPVNTSIYVTFVNDSARVKQLKNNEKISFEIIKYNRDTLGHFANCLWADYDATIKLTN